MKLSIVILNYNTRDLTINCLQSVKSEIDSDFPGQSEVIVVDNSSSDDSVSVIARKFPWVKLIQNKKNLGFAVGNNVGIKKSKGDYLLLLNSDTTLHKGALANLFHFIDQSNYGIVSGLLKNRDGSIQPNCGDLPTLTAIFFWLSNLDNVLGKLGLRVPSFHRSENKYYQTDHPVGWVSGAAIMIKRSIIQKVGLLDEKIFMYAEDVDFCLRAQKRGINTGFCHQSIITHLGGGSQNNPSYRQWSGEFQGLFFIYRKYYSRLRRIILRLMVIIFVVLRAVIFLITAKFRKSITYFKIFASVIGPSRSIKI